MASTSAPSNSGQDSTPFSRHISAHSQSAGYSATVTIVDKYIDEDLKNSRSTSFEQFLIGLGADEDSVRKQKDEFAARLREDPQIKQLVSDYCKAKDELARYGPFCELANYIISKLEDGKIIFSRNDPKVINGVRKSVRKPDVVAVDKRNPSVANERWKDYSARGPKSSDVTWTWPDFWLIAEFQKRKDEIHVPGSTEAAPKLDLDVSPVAALPGPSSSSSTRHVQSHSTSTGSKSRRSRGMRGSRGGRTTSQSMQQNTSSSTSRKRLILQEAGGTEGSEPKKLKGETAVELLLELERQAARYCTDTLSSVPNRRHCLQVLILDGFLNMGYYDRSGKVISARIAFLVELYLFILLIKTLAELSRVECGWLEQMEDISMQDIKELPPVVVEALGQDVNARHGPAAQPAAIQSEGKVEEIQETSLTVRHVGGGSGGASDVPDGRLEELEKPPAGQTDGVHIHSSADPKKSVKHLRKKPKWRLKAGPHDLYLVDQVGHKPPVYGWVTRGGRVFIGFGPSLDDKDPARPYAVKLSWPQKRRTSEGDILKQARAELEKLDKLDINSDFKKKYGDRSLQDCLPEVKLCVDLDDLQKENSFRRRVFGEEYLDENRVFRCLVFEYLVPLYKLTKVSDFKQSIRDMVLGHHFLATSKSRILHRDISLGNLMVRIRNGEVHGVLNDWDLAEMGEHKTDGHTGVRTGTRPYMAWELFESDKPPRHLERFDWESFFYVICIVGSRYSEGELKHPQSLSDWDDAEDDHIRNAKYNLLLGGAANPLRLTEFYKSVFEVWIEPLQNMFKVGLDAFSQFRRRPSDISTFDLDTYGGHVTWEKLWAILEN